MLHCQNHGRPAKVSSAEDFAHVPLGGCTEICGELMPCGHSCRNSCHAFDPEHLKLSKKCKEKCIR